MSRLATLFIVAFSVRLGSSLTCRVAALPAGCDEAVKTIDFRISQKARFVTPIEFVEELSA